MAKDATKVIKVVLSKLEIGTSAAGAEPTYTDIGFFGEAAMKIEGKPNVFGVGDGSDIQKGYDCSVEVDALEVINFASFETFKNTNVWIKGTPVGTPSATNPYVRAMNFICNLEPSIDLAVKGKSRFKITGKKLAIAFADFCTTAGS